MQPALSAADFPVERTTTTNWRLGLPTYSYAVVFASLCIIVGLLWDIMWHISIGRDGLFSAPHVVMYVGALVSGLFSGYQILALTLRKNHPDRAKSVRFWGFFYGSLGAMFCVWGALTMLTSAPFDDWWHATYGLDVQIMTPPHTVLLLGMVMVQFGAVVAVLSLQNQPASQVSDQQQQRIRLLFVLSGGFMLSVLSVFLSENMGEQVSHHSSYYTAAAIAFPLLLLALGRAGQRPSFRYPITAVAVVYMLAIALPNWILPLFPAEPKLGPVVNPITHYQAFTFPLLLVIPGYALDRLMQWAANRPAKPLNDWLLALLAGVVFMGVFLAVQWPFGGFLHESPLARNWFFLRNAWGYDADPNWEYRFRFHPHYNQTAMNFIKNFGEALLIAFVSARIGLFWGNWMRRVVR